MEAYKIEDTVENRIAMLEGLLDAWEADEDTNMEKDLWVFTLRLEILMLKTRESTKKLSSVSSSIRKLSS